MVRGALWALTCLLAAERVGAQTAWFRLGAEAPVGARFAGPLSIAAGDFNGDGIPDLAAGDYDGSSLTVILRNADGTFRPQLLIPLNAKVRQIALADLDADGKLDLVAICNSPNLVAVVRGKGDGTFEPPARIALASAGNAILAADLNGDGIVDLAIGQSQGVLLAPGNGDATFASPQPIPLDVIPVAIQLSDLNGDGIPDLAVAGTGSPDSPFTSELARIYILLGTVEGHFRQPSPIVMGRGRPSGIAIGDFNKDGRPDIAVADQYNSQYLITLGNGDGTFGELNSFPMADGPLAVAAADFNADGISDLVIGNYYGGKVAILLGNGDGTFQRMPDILVKGDTFAVFVADMNGDGLADVLTANHSSQSVAVALGCGGGLFNPAVNLLSSPSWISLAGTDPEGTPVLAVTNFYADRIVVLREGMKKSDDYPVGTTPNRVVQGDFNGDAIPDLAILNADSGDLSVLLGKGSGAFQPALTFPLGKYPASIAVADFNHDGLADLVVTLAFDDALVLMSKGNGEFEIGSRLPAIHGSFPIAAADLNLDGLTDLATGGEVFVLLAKSGGLFDLVASYYLQNSPGEIVIADVNGDGKPDIISSFELSGAVMLGKGDGAFEPAKRLPSPPQGEGIYSGMTPGDFNGDGKLDLAVLGMRGVMILPGNGDGTFGTPIPSGIDARPEFLCAVDWNQDGKTDLVVANRQAGTVSVWINQR